MCLSGKIDRHILDNPSANDTVVGENQNRNCRGNVTQEREFLVDGFVGENRTLSGSSADCNFGCHQGKAEGNS